MDQRAPLFIDWHGTLSDSRFWGRLRQSRPGEYESIQHHLFFENRSLADAWMRGEQTSEQICERLSGKTNMNAEALLAELVFSCERMHLDDELKDAIRSLQHRFRLILATDNMDCFSRFTVPKLKLDELFDDLLISSDVKTLKEDDRGKLFSSFLVDVGSDFTNAFCIDNSASACNLFESLGGRAIKTKDTKDTVHLLRNLYMQPARNQI